jgi:hypothetical protein
MFGVVEEEAVGCCQCFKNLGSRWMAGFHLQGLSTMGRLPDLDLQVDNLEMLRTNRVALRFVEAAEKENEERIWV